MSQPVYPPMESMLALQSAVNSLYTALKALPTDGSAGGNIAALGGALESLLGLETSWMVTGIG